MRKTVKSQKKDFPTTKSKKYFWAIHFGFVLMLASPFVMANAMVIPANGVVQKIGESESVRFDSDGNFSGTFDWYHKPIYGVGKMKPLGFLYQFQSKVSGVLGGVTRSIKLDPSNWNDGKTYRISMSQKMNFVTGKENGETVDGVIYWIVHCPGATNPTVHGYKECPGSNNASSPSSCTLSEVIEIEPQDRCSNGKPLHLTLCTAQLSALTLPKAEITVLELGDPL